MFLRHRILSAKKALINNPIRANVAYYMSDNTHGVTLTATYAVASDVTGRITFFGNLRKTLTITTGNTEASVNGTGTADKAEWFSLTPEKDDTYIYLRGTATFTSMW